MTFLCRGPLPSVRFDFPSAKHGIIDTCLSVGPVAIFFSTREDFTLSFRSRMRERNLLFSPPPRPKTDAPPPRRSKLWSAVRMRDQHDGPFGCVRRKRCTNDFNYIQRHAHPACGDDIYETGTPPFNSLFKPSLMKN